VNAAADFATSSAETPKLAYSVETAFYVTLHLFGL